uniref:Galactosylgalactosylxylosylprotein 3-beta-glucuronosyltransferase n=1 Tax=Rhabditophanes sp. KR3021 TaxID=114890 RepID=A0AC35TQ49_9BILA
MADMISLANTLSHVEALHWLIIEDQDQISDSLDIFLEDTNIEYTYLGHKTPDGYPKKGWYQRDMAVKYIYLNHKALTKGYANTVIYFADDDNTYDIRLFNKYIRKVKKIGVWCCGFLAGHATRAPIVNEKNKVVGFTNGREMIHNFQIDMAMFAISIDAIMTHPHFEVGKTCDDNRNGPEKCMLRNFNFTMNDFEPFGKLSKKKGPMEVLVYHVRTKKPNVVGSAMIEDYDIEI